MPNNSSKGPEPQHFMLPNARELRAQAVHRLQIGLFGLAAMLLLVGLANIIMDRARMADGNVQNGAAMSNDIGQISSDPLADLGAVPSPGPSNSGAQNPAGSSR